MWLICKISISKLRRISHQSSSYRIQSEAGNTFVHVILHNSFHLVDDSSISVIQVRLLGRELMQIIPFGLNIH